MKLALHISDRHCLSFRLSNLSLDLTINTIETSFKQVRIVVNRIQRPMESLPSMQTTLEWHLEFLKSTSNIINCQDMLSNRRSFDGHNPY